mgnify:CR=1 FL=1
MQMDVQGLDDVKRWGLQHGGEVEMVDPGLLREMIIKEINILLENYKI